MIITIALILLIGIFYLSTSKKNDISFLPERFVVFDLETTGLDPLKHEIIEIGAIKVDRNSTRHETFQYLITPSKKVPNRITAITGITQEMIDKEGRDPNEVLGEFITFIGDHRLVAFNANFDMSFIKAATANHG